MQICFMGIFDRLIELSSPVRWARAIQFVKIVTPINSDTWTFCDCVEFKEVELSWFVKLDTKVVSRSSKINCCKLARVVIIFHSTQLKFPYHFWRDDLQQFRGAWILCFS